MAVYYREQVTALAGALTTEENRAEAADLLRALIDNPRARRKKQRAAR